MPEETSSSQLQNDEEIAAHLRRLAERYEDESTLLRVGVIPLLLGLGYSKDEIFFDYSIPWLSDYYRVDVAVAADRRSIPWLIVEVKAHTKSHDLMRSMAVLSGLAKACGARGMILLTQHLISVATTQEGSFESHMRLEAMTGEWAHDLLTKVGRNSLQNIPAGVRVPFFSIAVEEPSGRFAIDRTVLEQRLESCCSVTSAAEKGDSFEALASYMLAGLSCVETRRKNVATATGELDLVCRFKEGETPAFLSGTGDRYFVVECKNWQVPVSSKEVEVFIGKLQKCRSHFGLLFSRNGITGRTGRDAVGNIEAAWRQHGVVIVVVSEETVRQVVDGFDFYSILERLYEAVRFSER